MCHHKNNNIFEMEENISVNLEDIKKLENKLGCSFPKDYKKYMIEKGGGKPKKRFIKNKDYIIQKVFPIRDSSRSVYNVYSRVGDVIGEGVVPVAQDPFGNMFCIAISGNEYGSVYFWDHEMASKTKISNSFTELMSSTVSKPES